MDLEGPLTRLKNLLFEEQLRNLTNNSTDDANATTLSSLTIFSKSQVTTLAGDSSGTQRCKVNYALPLLYIILCIFRESY